MKKILLALALLLAPSLAWAQCNGVFPANTICGNASGSSNIPSPTASTSFPVTLVVGSTAITGGTNLLTLYDNNGILGERNIFANPTGTIGLTAVNGTATTALRSDGAPPLSQAIVPTWTGLHTFTTTAGGISLTGNPNSALTNTQLGLTTSWGLLGQLTTVSATVPEGVASFNLTSAVGAANLDTAFKAALSATATCNSGSANCWAQTNVATAGIGGTKRGVTVLELDLDNNFGNYTGVPAGPYAANLYLSGTNTGGYGSCAICIEFAANANPLWNYGIHLGTAGFQVYNTAAILDDSNAPTSFIGKNGIIIGTATLARQSQIQGYVSNNSLQIVGRFENDNGVSPTSAIGFQVTSSGSETRSAKGGVGYARSNTNGRGTLNFYNRATNDTSDFTTSDIVASISNAGVFNIPSTTASTSSTTGALTVTGGVGVALDLFVAGKADLGTGNTKGLYIAGAPIVQQIGNYSFLFSSDGPNGAFQIGNSADPTIYINATTFNIRSLNTATTFATITATKLGVLPTTVSTSKTTGAITNAGGFGNAGAIFTDTLSVITMANTSTTSAVCYNTGTGLTTYNGTVGTCTVSDERLKNMGKPIDHALSKLLAINGVNYTWKDSTYGTGPQLGVGAQTVEKVFPELVQTGSDGYKSVDYQRLTAPIIEALRELKHDNDNIRAEIIKLKHRRM